MFFKIERWNFQVQFEIGFRETSQNFNSFSFFRELLFSPFLSVVWLSWNFVRFHEILFQTDAESFSVLSWKTNKFYSWKNIFQAVVNINTRKICLLTQFLMKVLHSTYFIPWNYAPRNCIIDQAYSAVRRVYTIYDLGPRCV